MPPDTPPTDRRDGQNRRLCKAHRRDGELCTQPAMDGQAVCKMHGGQAPQTKRKAALRLLELVDPAIATLAREMVQASKSSDKQRAANSILDRAGYGRVHKVEATDARELLVQRLLALQGESAPTPSDLTNTLTDPARMSRILAENEEDH